MFRWRNRSLRGWWRYLLQRLRNPYVLPLPAELIVTVEDEWDPDFFLGAPERTDASPEYFCRQQEQRAKRRAGQVSPFGENKQRDPSTRSQVEYVFNEPEGHKPMPPRSALIVPRPLTKREGEAVALLEMVEGIQLKPYLNKKVKALKKGQHRVWFDEKGKQRIVK